MIKERIKQRFRTATIRAVIAALLISFIPLSSAEGAGITSRRVTIGTSQITTATTHNYQFTAPSATTVLSADFLYCTTASGACTTPTGMSSTGASLNGQPTNLGSGGTWTGTFTTNGRLQIANASNTGSPSANTTANFNAVTNPTSPVGTFYVRITTYSAANWTGAIDTGVVAFSTAAQISVTASVDESLTFCVYTGSCGTNNPVALGVLSSAAGGTRTGTSNFSVGTNAGTGYVVTYTGSTLTGPATITGMAAQAVMTNGTNQFGLNVVANTGGAYNGSSAFGAAPTNSGTASSGYQTNNQFKFTSGDQVASFGGPTTSGDQVYTVSYAANVASGIAAGSYSTTLTYIATATF